MAFWWGCLANLQGDRGRCKVQLELIKTSSALLALYIGSSYIKMMILMRSTLIKCVALLNTIIIRIPCEAKANSLLDVIIFSHEVDSRNFQTSFGLGSRAYICILNSHLCFNIVIFYKKKKKKRKKMLLHFCIGWKTKKLKKKGKQKQIAV